MGTGARVRNGTAEAGGTPAVGQPGRRILIVGGVAGGMSAATRLRRLDESASITVLERSGHVSYANCGLPYFVGGVIEDEDDLLLQTPERLFERFRLDVRVGTEVVGIDPATHTVTVRPTGGGSCPTTVIAYDALVLSPGAAPVRPPLPGFDRVRVLRTVEDAEQLEGDASTRPRTAVVIGAGFVGLETAENLSRRGIATTVIEMADQVLTPLDPELAVLVAAELERNGVRVRTGVGVAEVTDDGVVLADGQHVPGDLVVAAIGVRPDVGLAEMAGLEIGPHGGIAVDADGRTSAPDVYAVGDAVEKADARRRPVLAHRPGQHRQPAGPPGGRPDLRPAGAPGALAGHGHREGVRAHRGHDRVEREAAAGVRALAIASSARTP